MKARTLFFALALGAASSVSAQPAAEVEAPPPEQPDVAPAPPAAPATPDGPAPVVVIPVPGANLTEAIANATLTATTTQLGTVVRGRGVRLVADGAVVAATMACAQQEEGAAACRGAQVAAAGGASGVLVNVSRASADAPVSIRYEVIDSVTGDPRASAATELPADGISAAALQDTIAQLAPGLPAPPARGSILVAVNVDGAMVAVDGQMVGESPVAPVEVPPGSHTVSVNRAGFQPYSRSVEVTLDGVRVNADLQPDEEEMARLADLEDEAREQAEGPKPWYKRWYVWAAAGAVLVGASVAVGVAAGGADDPQGFNVPPILP